jgi:hypothetical protein
MYVYSLCATREKTKEEETAQPETWSSRRDFFFYCYEARAPAQPDAANTSPAQSFFLFHLKKNKNKGYYFFVSFCVDKIFYLLLPFIVRVEI